MKNIHVLPTDKPSSIGYDGVKNLHFVNDFIDDYQNIYITSDEEIKDGDWFLTDDKRVEKDATDWRAREWHRKIILTTDQDLIKDGVQAIPNEFLEWLVKNPSCEYIKIENVYDKFLNSGKRSVSDFRKKYKIIIPKEEPKQEHNKYLSCCKNLEECHCDKKLKQETPEEETLSKIKFVLSCNNDAQAIRLLEQYGQWQAERMYSEEEVEDLIYKVCGTVARLQGIILNGNHIDTAYEQFKKK